MAARYGTLLGALVCVLSPTRATGQGTGHERPIAQTRPANESGRENWTIQTEQQAIAKARESVGLPDRGPARLSAELVILNEDNTPFLHDQLVGRPIWRVVIEGWRLVLRSAPPDEHDPYARVFDVYIDPGNGTLLKAVSRWPEGVPASAPAPSAKSAEEQMPRSGQEKYHSFPGVPAQVDLLMALDVVQREVASPYLAKQIVADYVLRSSMGREPRPVWAITLRGIPPIKPPPPGVSIDALNHLRCIVDGETGKFMGAGTSPQPETGATPSSGTGPK